MTDKGTTSVETAVGRDFVMNSKGVLDLRRALLVFFGPGRSLYYQVTSLGFCVATSAEDPRNIPVMRVIWNDPTPASITVILEKAMQWLDGLSESEKFSLTRDSAEGRYAGCRLDGFKAMSYRTDDGRYEVLVIQPGWV